MPPLVPRKSPWIMRAAPPLWFRRQPRPLTQPNQTKQALFQTAPNYTSYQCLSSNTLGMCSMKVWTHQILTAQPIATIIHPHIFKLPRNCPQKPRNCPQKPRKPPKKISKSTLKIFEPNLLTKFPRQVSNFKFGHAHCPAPLQEFPC